MISRSELEVKINYLHITGNVLYFSYVDEYFIHWEKMEHRPAKRYGLVCRIRTELNKSRFHDQL